MSTIETQLTTVRILIVDDQALIRQTIQMYLEQESDLEIIGYAENGTEALKQIEILEPDIAIVDLEMPDMDGLTTIQIIRDRFIQTKILILSSHDDRQHINQAIEAGAKGYLVKGTPAQELANAVRSLSKGYFQLGPGLMEKLVISMSNSADANDKSLEQKLIVAFKKFKQDTNKQLDELVETKLLKINQHFEQDMELKILSSKKRQNQLFAYVRKVEFRLYLLLFFQAIILFIILFYWLINS
ncbi:response regulator [Pleurocapsa sp. FMAR1]|uniref:response regulator n=1 Tax=Pleurocapsa sp. FMAR1 TaxID=3040204 RepID=UPI0029C7A510|nr:response regulator transcription factor [Pleurocapsa sp. FMAR1]